MRSIATGVDCETIFQKGKTMKKLSLLIALILCVTIGGVYATWSYTASNDVADEKGELTIALVPQPNIIGTYGTYAVDVSGVTVAIDQKDEGDHTAVLKFSDDSKVVISFTPATNAPLSVKENGVESTFSIRTSKDFVYKTDAEGNYSAEGTDKPVFTFQNHQAQAFDWTKDPETGVFSYTIDATALRSMITLNTFVLDTLAEYQAFSTAIEGSVVFTVSDGIVSTNP